MGVQDICGPIDPPAEFNYSMVIKDGSSRYIDTHLLATKNLAFVKILTTIIQLKNLYHQASIKLIRVDNAKSFYTFENYCIATGINLETSITQVHNTNEENAVKLIQNVARMMLLSSQLPSSCWGYAVLHATQILRLRPTSG
jgi:hypothetical protein